MGEKFETRLMELMLDRADRIDLGTGWDTSYTIEVSEAIECVRQMLSEFEAVIYQP